MQTDVRVRMKMEVERKPKVKHKKYVERQRALPAQLKEHATVFFK